MAIAFDSSAVSRASSGNLSFSHTCTGSDLVLIVMVFEYAAGVANPSVTYNGVAMTLLDTRDNGGTYRVSSFYLANPATGAHTVAVTFGGSSPVARMAGSVSFSGCDTTNPIDVHGTAASSANKNPTVTLSLTKSADAVVGFSGSQVSNLAVSNGQNVLWVGPTNEQSSGIYSFGDYKIVSGGGSFSDSQSGSTGFNQWAMISLAIAEKPSRLSNKPVIVSQVVKRANTY